MFNIRQVLNWEMWNRALGGRRRRHCCPSEVGRAGVTGLCQDNKDEDGPLAYSIHVGPDGRFVYTVPEPDNSASPISDQKPPEK